MPKHTVESRQINIFKTLQMVSRATLLVIGMVCQINFCLTVDGELGGVGGAAGGVGRRACVVSPVAELEAVDDERGGVLVVGPDGERGVVLWRAQARAVLVPPEGDRQVALQNLKFFLA